MGKAGRPKGPSSRRDNWRKGLRTVQRKPIRPLERQRMRPWLQTLLEDGECKQIAWMNKKEKTFRMAWKHAAGQNWDRGQDCNIFELWARHTGKYYDGDKPDHKKWKANFRCALNSLLDVEELKEQGVRKGNNAFRVYKFLDERRTRKRAIKAEVRDEEEEFVYRSPGTKSRPRKPVSTQIDLDSEGSEVGNEHELSDVEMIVDVSKIKQEEHSPLPKFDQICPFALQTEYENINSTMYSRVPEASSPQTHSSSSDEDNQSTTSSAPTDDEVILMLLEPGEVEPEDFWKTYQGMDEFNDIPIQEGPEEIISEDGTILPLFDGPNVIVIEGGETADFAYTGLDQFY